MRAFKKYFPSFALVTFLVLVVALSLPSCKEVGPNINLNNSASIDTTYLADTLATPQQKNVLLEDFTGVRCKNCPTGAATAASLADANPGRLVLVGIHSNFLDDPYGSDPDLRTTEAQDIEDMLGPLIGKPSAAIDRALYSGQSAILVAQVNAWPAAVNQALTATTPVNVGITSSYNSADNSITATVTLTYTETVTNDNRLTVMVTEDSILTAQLLPNDSINNAYYQEHVLRTTLSQDNGDPITDTKEPKRVIVKQYKLASIPADWNVDHLNIVAIAHEFNGSFKVLQVQEVKAK